MLVSLDQPSSSANYQSREQNGNNYLHKNYFIIKNIFDGSVYQHIPEWCKNLPSYSQLGHDDNLYRNPREEMYTSVAFDKDYKIIDRGSYLNEGTSSSKDLNEFICIVVERFAKELKLIGENKIHVYFYRTRYSEGATKMKEYQLGWHYDKHAKSTFTAVFQNDFPYEKSESAGLDIAVNEFPGPHEPDPIFPTVLVTENHYLSCPYNPNEAIIFHGQQGKIVHRRSILAKPLVPNATRTVIQIKLKDLNWKET